MVDFPQVSTLAVYLILAVLAAVFAALLSWRIGVGRRPERADDGRIKTCPLCRTRLSQGERLKSVVFSGGTRVRDIVAARAHLFGCPHCFPANSRHPRICPYCRQRVPDDGFVIARMFDNSTSRKKQVHVLGCTGCKPNYGR